MKRLLLFAVAGLLSVSVVAQVFKVGDTRANLSIGVGSLSSSYGSAATFDQHFTMEWGVASIGDKFTIGIGFAINNNFRDLGSSSLEGQYDYSISTKYDHRNYLTDYRLRTDYRIIHRKGTGNADCDLSADHVDLLFLATIHYSLIKNLDLYGIVGAGMGVMTYPTRNIENVSGFSERNYQGSEDGNRYGSGYYFKTYPYYYNDLDHVKWEGIEPQIVPSIAVYIGATYYFSEHWGIDLQVGLLNANFIVNEEHKFNFNSFGTFAVGATYKF